MPNVRIGEQIHRLIERLDFELPQGDVNTLDEWVEICQDVDAEPLSDQGKSELILEHLRQCQRVMAHVVMSQHDELTEEDYQ